jgi:uncharacterized protein (TIGR02145 family)
MKLLWMAVIFFFVTGAIRVGAQESNCFTDSRDGKIYRILKIGDQTWMAENLAYLPAVNRVSESQFEGKCFYVYGYDGTDMKEAATSDNYVKYGVLYNWEAALNSCPAGWHLPTDTEWKEMEKYLGMNTEEAGKRNWRNSGKVGDKLKSVTGWITNRGTGETGFSAIPAGCRGYEEYGSLGFCAYFWTASPVGGDNSWRRSLCGDDSGSNREEERRYFGLSVRCVKDK